MTFDRDRKKYYGIVKVSSRCRVLIQQGAVSGLLRMSGAVSQRTRTSVSLALSYLAREMKHRGVCFSVLLYVVSIRSK